jgi:mono/diheme cytochrome c family protein
MKLSFSGSDLYRTYCASCHGKGAKGDGPLAEYMKRRPSDLTAIAARNDGKYDVEMVARIIDGRKPVPGHGGHDMPVWGDAFKLTRDGSSEESVKARVDALVGYLESLQATTAPAAPPAGSPAGQ